MKKILALSILSLILFFAAPVSAATEASAGIKPGSFFYFLDTTFENISLFFTFDSGNKARKALEYADERLAEIQAIAEEKNPDAVKTAIANYESNVALATEKSKEVKDKNQAESLLTLIGNSTTRNQEILSAVLIKVPEEAKEAITQAIEASRKGHEEAARQIAELKGEVEQLKQEVSDLKTKDEKRAKIIEELSEQKPENTSKATSVPTSIKSASPKTSDTTQAPKPAMTPSHNQTKNNEPQVIQPPVQPPTSNTTDTTPTPTGVTQTLTTIGIASVNVTSSLSSAHIEWQTNIPTNSKIFLSSKVYSSESGLSTRHIVNATGLTSDTTYSYEIEAIVGDQVVKKQGSFTTKPDEKKIFIEADKTSIPLADWDYVTLTVNYTKNGEAVPVAISFSASDSALDATKTYSIVANDFKPLPTGTIPCGNYPLVVEPSNNSNAGFSGGLCTSDGKVKFYYRPKNVGTHTVSISADGIIKTFDIQATEYVKVDPNFERRLVYPAGAISPVEVPEYSAGYQNATIANFSISGADEPFKMEEIGLESDVDKNKFRCLSNGSYIGCYGAGANAPLNGNNIIYQIKIDNTAGIPLGTHTLTIKEIRVIGQKSGLYRSAIGLPITFSFVIK